MLNETKSVVSRSRTRQPRRALAILAGVVGLGLGAWVLYGLRGTGKEASAACVATAATVDRVNPLVHGEVAALSPARSSGLLPDLSFKGDGGAPKTLADFKGQTVLLNLWATWCVPCRREMPALDRLQDEFGGAAFQVVAVNIDTAKLDRPKQFLKEVGVTHLPFYADPTAAVFQTLRENGPVLGLPTTFLIDRSGCVIATMAGPADWASDEARKVIEAAKS